MDFKKYKILGVCNPQFEHQALSAGDCIGTILSCDVIVQEHIPGSIEISTVDFIVSSIDFQNEKLGKIAKEVRRKLKNVISNLSTGRNESKYQKCRYVIRILLAIAAVLFFTRIIAGTHGINLLVVGAVLLLTSFINFWPVYQVLGISTNKN